MTNKVKFYSDQKQNKATVFIGKIRKRKVQTHSTILFLRKRESYKKKFRTIEIVKKKNLCLRIFLWRVFVTSIFIIDLWEIGWLTVWLTITWSIDHEFDCIQWSTKFALGLVRRKCVHLRHKTTAVVRHTAITLRTPLHRNFSAIDLIESFSNKKYCHRSIGHWRIGTTH